MSVFVFLKSTTYKDECGLVSAFSVSFHTFEKNLFVIVLTNLS